MDIKKVKCGVCGHEWIPRAIKPIKCPNVKCQSADWADPPIIYKKNDRGDEHGSGDKVEDKKEAITKPREVITLD